MNIMRYMYLSYNNVRELQHNISKRNNRSTKIANRSRAGFYLNYRFINLLRFLIDFWLLRLSAINFHLLCQNI